MFAADMPPETPKEILQTMEIATPVDSINKRYDEKTTFNFMDYPKLDGFDPDKLRIDQTSNWPTILTKPSSLTGMASPSSRPGRGRRGGISFENAKAGVVVANIAMENYSRGANDFIAAPYFETDWNFEKRNGINMNGEIYVDVANMGDFAKKNDFSKFYAELFAEGGNYNWPVIAAFDLELFSDYGITDTYKGLVSESIGPAVEGRIGIAPKKGLKLGEGEIDASLTLFKLFGSGESFDFNADPELRIAGFYPISLKNGEIVISGEAKLHHNASTDQNTGFIKLTYNPEGSGRGFSLSNLYGELGSGIFQNNRDDGVFLVYVGTGIKF